MFSHKLRVGLVALCVSAGIASATTTKIQEFQPFGGGCLLNPDVDGIAIMRFHTTLGTTHFHLHVQDLQPHQWYGVMVVASGECDFVFSNCMAIFTNARGNGTYEADFLPLSSPPGPTPTVYIYQRDCLALGSPSSITDLSCAEFRAVGPEPITPTLVCPLVPVCSCSCH